jgi:hypothetical protein
MRILEVLTDATAHFEDGVLIRCDIGATTAPCSGIEYLMYKLLLIMNRRNIFISLW